MLPVSRRVSLRVSLSLSLSLSERSEQVATKAKALMAAHGGGLVYGKTSAGIHAQ